MYISFTVVDQDLHLGLLESPHLFSSLLAVCLQGLLPLIHILHLVVWLLSMYKLCHVIHAQWSSCSSHTLLCHLWICLSTWFCFPLPISWWLGLASSPRSSTTHMGWGSHTNPSHLSQAYVCGGRNKQRDKLTWIESQTHTHKMRHNTTRGYHIYHYYGFATKFYQSTSM